MEEIGTRSSELVTANESSVISKPPLDTSVMEDGQGDGCLADPSDAYESDGIEVFREVDDSSNQFVASKAGSWCRWRYFPHIDSAEI